VSNLLAGFLDGRMDHEEESRGSSSSASASSSTETQAHSKRASPHAIELRNYIAASVDLPSELALIIATFAVPVDLIVGVVLTKIISAPTASTLGGVLTRALQVKASSNLDESMQWFLQQDLSDEMPVASSPNPRLSLPPVPKSPDVLGCGHVRQSMRCGHETNTAISMVLDDWEFEMYDRWPWCAVAVTIQTDFQTKFLDPWGRVPINRSITAAGVDVNFSRHATEEDAKSWVLKQRRKLVLQYHAEPRSFSNDACKCTCSRCCSYLRRSLSIETIGRRFHCSYCMLATSKLWAKKADDVTDDELVEMLPFLSTKFGSPPFASLLFCPDPLRLERVAELK
jgi:hypothetical protein